MADQALSCWVDPTDVTGLFDTVAISGPPTRFFVDNARINVAAWARESNCFANRAPVLAAGLGELEIKPESLRYVVCATSDLLQDASFNIENYILDKGVPKACARQSATRSLEATASASPPAFCIQQVEFPCVMLRQQRQQGLSLGKIG